MCEHQRLLLLWMQPRLPSTRRWANLYRWVMHRFHKRPVSQLTDSWLTLAWTSGLCHHDPRADYFQSRHRTPTSALHMRRNESTICFHTSWMFPTVLHCAGLVIICLGQWAVRLSSVFLNIYLICSSASSAFDEGVRLTPQSELTHRPTWWPKLISHPSPLYLDSHHFGQV